MKNNLVIACYGDVATDDVWFARAQRPGVVSIEDLGAALLMNYDSGSYPRASLSFSTAVLAVWRAGVARPAHSASSTNYYRSDRKRDCSKFEWFCLG